ncbi:hypothetical protein BZG36_03239 [Bifiguratus adelaidae]|uniref:DASH complex subunit SPC19 n=1 Tax=Bifiguratus adelaidae TaxID=1938954 RepID=A0A261Y024_9FUNG|nr:hypothetical protein BZG36_03239 [Bifiguratus adelaidae]
MQGSESEGFRPPSALDRSVYHLHTSLTTLHSCITALNQSTQDLPRLNHLLRFKRKYEVITEDDIGSARSQLATEVRPELEKLLNKAEDLLWQLDKDSQLLEKKIEAQEESLNVLKMGNDSAEEQNAKKAEATVAEQIKVLKRLKQRKETLRKSVEEKMEQHRHLLQDNKRIEAEKQAKSAQISKERSNQAVTTQSIRSQRNVLQRELTNLESQLTERRAILREKEASRSFIKEHENQVSVGDTLSASGNETEEKVINTDKWQLYPDQLRLLISIKDVCASGNLKGSTENLDALEKILRKYFIQSQKDRDLISSEILPERHTWKQHAVTQMKIMSKLLFPEGNIGITIGRMFEILLAKLDLVAIEKGLGASILNKASRLVFARASLNVELQEFPPSQEGRHHLQQVIRILSDIGLIETVMEVPDDNGTDGEALENTSATMMIRVKSVTPVLA